MTTSRNLCGALSPRLLLAANSTLFGVILFCPQAAQAQSTNSLALPPGSIRIFLGGNGTRDVEQVKPPTISWREGADLQSPANTLSLLDQRVLSFENYKTLAIKSSLGTDVVTATTSGTYEVMVVYRLKDGETKPSGKVYVKVTAVATANTGGGSGTITALSAKVGSQTGTSNPYRVSASQSGLITIDLSNATLQPGESDIYVATSQVGNLAVSASMSASSKWGARAVADSSATAQLDSHSVTLSRGGRDEHSELKDGEWHTYGDSIYSAQNPSDTLSSRMVPLKLDAAYIGVWNTRLTLLGIKYNVTPTWSEKGFDSTIVAPQKDETGCYGSTQFGTPVVDRTILPGVSNSYYTYHGNATGAKEYVTTLSLADNVDKATAKASYHLTLHDPLESAAPNQFTTYHIYAAVMDGAPVRRAYGNGQQQDVTVGESTEYGLGLTATTSIGVEQELLGFKADLTGEASYKSTFKIESGSTIHPPALLLNQFVFLMADHSFQRRHTMFWKYDEAGKIKRMITKDNAGVVYNPAVEVYHEAFNDTMIAPPTHFWTPPYDSTVNDVNTVPPTTPAPPLRYDYPSGGSS